MNHLHEAAITPKTKCTEERRDGHQCGAETLVKGLPKRPPDEPKRRGHQLEARTLEEGPPAGNGTMMWASKWD